MWKRLTALELEPPKERDPQILSRTPLTSFTLKKEDQGQNSSSPLSTASDKSPNSAKKYFAQYMFLFMC